MARAGCLLGHAMSALRRSTVREGPSPVVGGTDRLAKFPTPVGRPTAGI
jgi:hypothetical protein